jgi:hypothetical protein
MLGKQKQFLERFWLAQRRNAFAGCHFAALMLLLDAFFSAASLQGVLCFSQTLDFVFGGRGHMLPISVYSRQDDLAQRAT